MFAWLGGFGGDIQTPWLVMLPTETLVGSRSLTFFGDGLLLLCDDLEGTIHVHLLVEGDPSRTVMRLLVQNEVVSDSNRDDASQ